MRRGSLVNPGDELVLDDWQSKEEDLVSRVRGWCEEVRGRTLEVLLPVLSVLLLALLEVSSASMDEDADGITGRIRIDNLTRKEWGTNVINHTG